MMADGENCVCDAIDLLFARSVMEDPSALEELTRMAEGGDLQQVGRVPGHGLHVLQQPHMLGPPRCGPAEDAHPAGAGVHRKAADPRAVQLHADPGLHQVVVGVQLYPKFAAGKQQLNA